MPLKALKMSPLTTDRITLRQWQADDFPAFAEMSASAEVMEYFPSTLTRAQSDAVATKIMAKIEQNGFGFWALELNETGEFCGFVGLNRPEPELPFGPCLEIGWRLRRKFWGKGLASEGGRLALAYGFDQLEADEIVSFTAADNQKSQAVMKRLGFAFNGETFMHPALADGHPLKKHVLYRLGKKHFSR